MIVIYYDADTGRAHSLLQSNDLAGFPYAEAGSCALLLTEQVQLPGYMDGSTYVPLQPAPSSSHVFNWVTKVWEDPRTLRDLKDNGLVLVDNLAGAARLRYITSVPGQAETYQKKEQQARDWAASGFAGDPPSFIAAEALALNVSAQSVALEVIGLADYWSNIKGPQIEATRRKWKVAIDATVDPSLIPGLINSARTELEAL